MPDDPKPAARRWILFGGAAVLLALLVPAVVVPLAMGVLGRSAFASFAELPADEVAGVEVFVLNRPDGGPDIGSTQALHPLADPKPLLAWLAKAKPVPYERAPLLGRLVVRLTDGRQQEVLLNQHLEPGNPAARRVFVRYHIEQRSFDAGPVDEFVKLLEK